MCTTVLKEKKSSKFAVLNILADFQYSAKTYMGHYKEFSVKGGGEWEREREKKNNCKNKAIGICGRTLKTFFYN